LVLGILQVKQIAGRAGRRGSLFPEGITTTFFSKDSFYLSESMQQGFENATSAGLFPVYEQVSSFLGLFLHGAQFSVEVAYRNQR
jgi:ATP-dependent RNA helicase SUPV3L1/SUV3